MSLLGHGGPGDGLPLQRVVRFDGVPTVRHLASGTEYVEDDDGQYVPVVDSLTYETSIIPS